MQAKIQKYRHFVSISVWRSNYWLVWKSFFKLSLVAKNIAAATTSPIPLKDKAPKAMATTRESRATGPTAGCREVPIIPWMNWGDKGCVKPINWWQSCNHRICQPLRDNNYCNRKPCYQVAIKSRFIIGQQVFGNRK